ncbi:MAG: hypothetical protein ABIH46_11615 [Chloroflexota bacterium]
MAIEKENNHGPLYEAEKIVSWKTWELYDFESLWLSLAEQLPERTRHEGLKELAQIFWEEAAGYFGGDFSEDTLVCRALRNYIRVAMTLGFVFGHSEAQRRHT